MKLEDEEIEKVIMILKANNTTSIDLGAVGKLCKNTGMLSFFVKDSVNHFGLEDEKDKKFIKRRTRGDSMFKLVGNLDKGYIIREEFDAKLISLNKMIEKYDK